MERINLLARFFIGGNFVRQLLHQRLDLSRGRVLMNVVGDLVSTDSVAAGSSIFLID
ncbi:hypothetical protein [Brevundimonas diminuta]|uniref:hypothetical protein n=1 Tax=Brevundimonas diminuta TaxID=293 RepID=UPI003D9A2F01